MFTGIITDVGVVRKIFSSSRSYVIEIMCSNAEKNISIGDSVAVNGVCLSVVKKNGTLVFDIVNNTFEKTALKRLKNGSIVNLENALKFGDTLDGHMVSGHVDGERKILRNTKISKGHVLDIVYSADDRKFIIPRGSVAIDGISLTIGEVEREYFRIFIIPHTLDNTTLNKKKSGEFVNVEYDINAKYIYSSQNKITKDTLSKNGFF